MDTKKFAPKIGLFSSFSSFTPPTLGNKDKIYVFRYREYCGGGVGGGHGSFSIMWSCLYSELIDRKFPYLNVI